MSRKKVSQVLAIIGFMIAVVHAIHAFTLDGTIEYTEVSFTSPRVPPELDGYLIAFIVDTHRISQERLLGMVEELNQRQPDLVLLGGDFASISEMQWAIEMLSSIQTTDGIFGVEGNHDSYLHLFAAMRHFGITPLSNSGYLVRENFFVAGVEDLWNRESCVNTAIANATANDFVLLVSHNPDVAMQQDTTGVDLILSGHIHGGQITLFGLWAPYLTLGGNSITNYGHRFRQGFAKSYDDVPVYVSRGVGEYLPRVFSRPEVAMVRLNTED